MLTDVNDLARNPMAIQQTGPDDSPLLFILIYRELTDA